MQTIWLSPTNFVTGDPTLRVSYPFVSHPGTVVTCTEPGDLKWVSMGLRLPPDAQIEEIIICYEVSNGRSFISQVRVAEMTTPDLAIVIHDDPTHLTSTAPATYSSAVSGLVPSGAVTLELRLNFQDISDEILFGAVGVNVQTPAGRFVFASQFCPPSLLPHFAAVKYSDFVPYLLNEGFNSLTAAQSAFPLSTSARDLTSVTYASNSLDWAVLTEATRYCELHGNATLWLDQPDNFCSYGIVGTWQIRGGVKVVGQGSQGSTIQYGTAIGHFSSGIDCIQVLGNSDPLSVGGFAGTGGGFEHITIFKANRTIYKENGVPGPAYTGGRAIYIQAQNLNQRPGELWINDVLIIPEEYTNAANWQRCLEVDGSLATTPGSLGVRSVHGHKLRCAGAIDPSKSVYFHYVEHVAITGLQIDAGLFPSPGLTIEGDVNNLMLNGLICNGQVVIQDTAYGSVSGATGLDINPIVLTLATPLPSALVGQKLNVVVSGMEVVASGMVANSAANGTWVATVTSPTTISLPTSGNGDYFSGGTVVSTSPQDLRLSGRIQNLSVTSADASGTVCATAGVGQGNTPDGTQFTSISPRLRILSPQTAAFQLQVKTIINNVTGDGTIYQIPFDTKVFDQAGDFYSDNPPYSVWTCQVAGNYRMRLRALLSSLAGGTNTYIMGAIFVNGGASEYRSWVNLPSSTTQYATVEVIELLSLSRGDTVDFRVQANGGGRVVNVYGDSSDGFTCASGELI